MIYLFSTQYFQNDISSLYCILLEPDRTRPREHHYRLSLSQHRHVCVSKTFKKKGIHLWTLQRMFQPWREYGCPTHHIFKSASTLIPTTPKMGNTNKYIRNSTQCILKYTFKIIYMYITFPKVPAPSFFPFTQILRSLLTKRKKTWVKIFRLVDTRHTFF